MLKTKQYASLDGIEVDLELPVTADRHTFEDTKSFVTKGNLVVLGYLVNDTDCENPLESCDGLGRVYTSHKHAKREEIRNMQAALGLNEDWEPDIKDHDVEKEVAINLFNIDIDEQELILSREQHQEFSDNCQILKKKWHRECIEKGTLGDRDVVRLDVYSHGGTAFSVSGEGMQCQWDTARSAAVWVPDDSAREEIDRRAKVYAFGSISHGRPDGYMVVLDGQTGSEDLPKQRAIFKEWGEAFAHLESNIPKGMVPTKEKTEIGRMRARKEVARDSLEEYNAWLAGDCYGFVVSVNETKTGRVVKHEAVWSIIGREAALEEMNMCIANTASTLTKKHRPK